MIFRQALNVVMLPLCVSLFLAVLVHGDTNDRHLHRHDHDTYPHLQSLVKHSDIILGGLFPMHEAAKRDSILDELDTRCSPRINSRGVQRAEAMLYAINTINGFKNILPGTSIRARIVDTCSDETHALNQSHGIIRSSVDILQECPKRASDNAVVGVVGGSYSSVSKLVAQVFDMFQIPQISPASTAIELSDRRKYGMFARTVPSDNYQVRAMIDFVQKMNWTFVSLVYSEGTYGESGMDFQQLTESSNTCIPVQRKLSHRATSQEFEEVVEKLEQERRARVVVMFLRSDHVRGLLRTVQRKNLTKRFQWLASDGWGIQEISEWGVDDAAEGAVTFEIPSFDIPDFREYLYKLRPEDALSNPWFKEYWQQLFNCTFQANSYGGRICDESMSLRNNAAFTIDNKIPYVFDAIEAFAYALDELRKQKCPNRNHCDILKIYNGRRFYKDYLLKTKFKGSSGVSFHFHDEGDGLPRYVLYNYRKKGGTSRYHYQTIGTWNGTLHLDSDIEDITWSVNVEGPGVPVSVCSKPCEDGTKKMNVTPAYSQCCWICGECDISEIFNGSKCSYCGDGKIASQDHTYCMDLQPQTLSWSSGYSIVSIFLSVLGILSTLVFVAIFVRHIDTPVVRAAGRELNFVILTGVLICFLNTFTVIVSPTTTSCSLKRFGVTFGFCIIYAGLFTKTNRIYRIFHPASWTKQGPSFISPEAQLVITAGLVVIQVFISLVWIGLDPPGVAIHKSVLQVTMQCKVEGHTFLVSLVYNLFLVVICTWQAVLTRKVPEDFNESRHLGFTMYTTCIIWLAFLPIYFATENSFQMRMMSQCVTISLCAYATLSCLFFPKVYIIIFHPEKNVRKSIKRCVDRSKHSEMSADNLESKATREEISVSQNTSHSNHSKRTYV